MVRSLIARAEAADAYLPELGSEKAAYLADLVETIRSAGAEPIFLVPPGGSDYSSGWLRRAQDDGIIPVVLDFGDPRPWPDLFTFDAWFDLQHLNKEASIRFSAYLADEVAGYLRAALPDLALPPIPTVDLALDLSTLAAESIGLEPEGGALVKAQTPAFLALSGVESLGAAGVVVGFGGTRQAAAVLQTSTGTQWSQVGGRVDIGPGREAFFDLTAAPPGGALRLKIIGPLGTRIEVVRVLGVPVPTGDAP
jgi:hypothetical protein